MHGIIFDTPSSVAFWIAKLIRCCLIGENTSQISLDFFILLIILVTRNTVFSLFIDITVDFHSPVMPSKMFISSLTFILRTFFKK